MFEKYMILLQPELGHCFRILLAAACGGFLGYERKIRRKEAGVRTHIIVALTAALVMVVSKYGFADVLEIPGMGVDPSRMAANIITGISFLGAGVIFVKEVSVRGLTTAAGLWATAGIGLAVGSGLYLLGIFTTAVLFIMQLVLHNKLSFLDSTVRDSFTVTYLENPQGLETLKAQMAERNIHIHHIEMRKNDDGTVTVKLNVSRGVRVTCTDLSGYFANNPNVRSFKL